MLKRWLVVCTTLLAACQAPPPAELHGRIDEFSTVELVAGAGERAEPGQRVTVHYEGWLYDDRSSDGRGSRFDSSRQRGKPFTFLLGAKQVIRGWDEGVSGMRVGGKRLLRLPPAFGYGSRGAGGAIPGEASLLFEVELLAVAPG